MLERKRLSPQIWLWLILDQAMIRRACAQEGVRQTRRQKLIELKPIPVTCGLRYFNRYLINVNN